MPPQTSPSSSSNPPPIPVSTSSSQSAPGGEGVRGWTAQEQGGNGKRARLAKGESQTESSACPVPGNIPPMCDGSSITPPRVEGGTGGCDRKFKLSWCRARLVVHAAHWSGKVPRGGVRGDVEMGVREFRMDAGVNPRGQGHPRISENGSRMDVGSTWTSGPDRSRGGPTRRPVNTRATRKAEANKCIGSSDTRSCGSWNRRLDDHAIDDKREREQS